MKTIFIFIIITLSLNASANKSTRELTIKLDLKSEADLCTQDLEKFELYDFKIQKVFQLLPKLLKKEEIVSFPIVRLAKGLTPPEGPDNEGTSDKANYTQEVKLYV